MTVSRTILDLVTKLAQPTTRAGAAEELAGALGGSVLLLFVRDIEVNQMLPVPGLPQTLPDGRAWHAFLQACISDGEQRGELQLSRDQSGLPVFGMAMSDDVAFVLAGTQQPTPLLGEFKALLPLLAAALRGEQQALVANSHAQVAVDAARKADSLARALDVANARLKQHAGAIAEANQMLQEQAVEMEAQAEELEAQAEALEMANRELALAQAAAEKASRAKSEFLTTMSHELRTPLNAISGYVQLLQLGIHGPITGAQREALERVHHSQSHLLKLINEILNLARIESGVVDYDISDLRLGSVIADILPLIEPQLGEKELQLRVELADESALIRADREKLDQILLNLLSNALKFTERGGVITIGSGPANGPKLMVTVTDSGIGIPADKLEAIFEPFVQAHAGLTRRAEGTGLGLSISRDLARGMNGDLIAQSTEGKGSVFTLMLPHVSQPRTSDADLDAEATAQ